MWAPQRCWSRAARSSAAPRRGDLIKNPLHQIVRDDADLIRAFARELGFTPSARSALTAVQEADEDDPLARWMAGKTG